jgi:hypothetical protein
MLLCVLHHAFSDAYDFFIRYVPEVSGFFFVQAGLLMGKLSRRFILIN